MSTSRKSASPSLRRETPPPNIKSVWKQHWRPQQGFCKTTKLKTQRSCWSRSRFLSEETQFTPTC